MSQDRVTVPCINPFCFHLFRGSREQLDGEQVPLRPCCRVCSLSFSWLMADAGAGGPDVTGAFTRDQFDRGPAAAPVRLFRPQPTG